jgi:phosphate:Na+ symporter
MDQMIYAVDSISAFLNISSDNHTLKLAVFDSLFKVMGVILFIPLVDKLVTLLHSIIKAKKVTEADKRSDHSKYLNDATLELPSTAMAAIVRETKHLYENAFEIITHGLNLKRSNIISSMPLNEVIKDVYSESIIDIDDFYNHNIKGIYGEIIDFSTKAQSQMSPKDIEVLYKLKLANRDIVEAVKDTKHLQKNLVKYSNSPNKHIKEQYNNIKRDLAELLRNIHKVATTEEEDVIILLLSKAKIHTEKYDILANGTLDNLIRNSLISNEMATSLMNDSAYAYNISKNLIAMAEIIFIDENSDIKNLGIDTMVMDETDIKLVLQKER